MIRDKKVEIISITYVKLRKDNETLYNKETEEKQNLSIIILYANIFIYFLFFEEDNITLFIIAKTVLTVSLIFEDLSTRISAISSILSNYLHILMHIKSVC